MDETDEFHNALFNALTELEGAKFGVIHADNEVKMYERSLNEAKNKQRAAQYSLSETKKKVHEVLQRQKK
jgi:hypothetical protein